MKKDIILTAAISAIIASTITVFASGPGEPFPDVDEKAYYADSIYNMRTLGVVAGYNNGNFGPNDFVTRGQLATMLNRYDKALLDPPWPSKSGISSLVELVCLGELDFKNNEEWFQKVQNEVCSKIK